MVTRGKFIAINAHIKEKQSSRRSYLDVNKLEIEEQIKLKSSRVADRMKFKAEVNEAEKRKTSEKKQQDKKLVH